MMNNLYDNQGYSNGNSYANNGYYGNQNNFYQSPQQMQQNKPMCLKGRPVTSIEEARALSIDLEEHVADIIATYGEDIIILTNLIFKEIEKDRYQFY